MDQDALEDYANTMKDGGCFPPVTVLSDNVGFWLADGFHRVAAAKVLELKTIRATVIPGGRREALLFAAGCNGNHGVRRTNADKQRAVSRLLKDQDWGGWSDAAIASHCRVDPKTVGTHRKAIYGSSIDGSRKFQRGGKKFVMNTADIGKTTVDQTIVPPVDPADQERLPFLASDPTDLIRRLHAVIAEIRQAACWKHESALTEDDMRCHVVALAKSGKALSKFARDLANIAEERQRRGPAAA